MIWKPTPPPQRIPIPVKVTGGQHRILLGDFGIGDPSFAIAEIEALSNGHNLYNYKLGDLFTPGAQALVFESQFETPLQTLWGFATVITRPQYFNPLHPLPYIPPGTVVTNGLGGLQAGSIQFQPLILEQG